MSIKDAQQTSKDGPLQEKLRERTRELPEDKDKMLRNISCEKGSTIVLTYWEIHFDFNYSLHSHPIFLLQIITMASGLRRFDLNPGGIMNQVVTCINNKANMLGGMTCFLL